MRICQSKKKLMNAKSKPIVSQIFLQAPKNSRITIEYLINLEKMYFLMTSKTT